MNLQEVDKKTDLPLMANFDQIQADHYLIDLKCDMISKVFEGDVIIFFKPAKIDQDCNECILDCCDISVLDVSQVIHDHSELPKCEPNLSGKRIPNSWKSNESQKSAKNTMTKWMNKQIIPLQFKSDAWSLHILNKDHDEDFPRVIRIKYLTSSKSRSLHWRKDQDGNPCVYTPAAAINNRGLFPCQDIPGAMATWQVQIHTNSQSNFTVLCTGDNGGDLLQENGIASYYFYTHLILPMSTFAIAIGSWKKDPILEGSLNENSIMLNLCGPVSIINQHFTVLKKYINACIEATSMLLGKYPLGKQDILILPRNFSGLGLASPNLMFLSPSLITGDVTLLVKIAHEISHAWFGIMIGAEDWTEAWISEGFATFLEEHIHDSALEILNWKTDKTREARDLRIYLRHTSLAQELNHTTDDLQQLRPMQGQELKSEDVGFVKNGMNPAAGLSQAHYLKGYFLLQYLYEIVGHVSFFALLQQYICTYMGELVNSTHFIRLFCEMFPDKCTQNDITLDWLLSTWLHSSGMPNQVSQLSCLNLSHNTLYSEVDAFFSEVCYLNRHLTKKVSGQKKQKVDVELMSDPLCTPEQISILFEKMLDIEIVQLQILKIVKDQHSKSISLNPDVNHRWCELVVKNKYRRCYSDVVDFLTNDQGMGVYLYGEMALSKNKVLIDLARNTFKKLEHELDVNSVAVIKDILVDFL